MTEARISRIYGEILINVGGYVPARNLHVSRVRGEVLMNAPLAASLNVSRVRGEVLMTVGVGFTRRRQGNNY